jgi:hypothetical protein
VADVWNDILYPALLALWNFINDYVSPILVALAEVAIAGVKLGFALLEAEWRSVLEPALRALWNFISSTLGPIIQWFADQVLSGWRQGFEAIIKVWNENLSPALSDLWHMIEDTLGPKIQWFVDNVIKQWKEGFEAIIKLLDSVVGWLREVKSWLDQLALPDWLQGHSPPPLATHLSMIADEMRNIALIEAPRLNRALQFQTPRLSMTLPSMQQVQIPATAYQIAAMKAGNTYQEYYQLSANYSHVQSEASIWDDLNAMRMNSRARR